MTQLDLARRCTACGTELGQAGRYCRGCGRLQDAAVEPATGPAWAPPRSAVLLATRPSTTGLLVVAVVVGAILAATLPLLVLRSTLFGPDDVAARYFSALADRDADGAWAQLARDDSGRAGNPLLSGAALRDPGYSPPDKVSITEMDVNGKAATAVVTYEVAGNPMTDDLRLERGGEGAGLLNRWRIDNGLLSLEVSASYADQLLVAGRSLPTDAEGSGGTFNVFPGAYAVTLRENPLVEIPPTALIAGAHEKGAITPTLKASVDRDVTAKVRAWLDDCAKSTELAPDGCPFDYRSYYEVTSVAWKITKDPEVRLHLDETGRVDVSGTGIAQISGKTTSLYDPSFEDTVSFSFIGAVVVANGAIQFQPGE